MTFSCCFETYLITFCVFHLLRKPKVFCINSLDVFFKHINKFLCNVIIFALSCIHDKLSTDRQTTGMGTQLHSQKGGRAPSPGGPIFGLFLLWPNGWMHQDAIWYGGRPQPRRLCVRWGLSPLPKKGRSPPIFGPWGVRQRAAFKSKAGMGLRTAIPQLTA